MLREEMTDSEAIAIVEEEMKKIPTSEWAKVVSSGFTDFSPVSMAVKNSVRRICVEGAKKEVIDYIPYVIWIVAGIIVLWLIFK